MEDSEKKSIKNWKRNYGADRGKDLIGCLKMVYDGDWSVVKAERKLNNYTDSSCRHSPSEEADNSTHSHTRINNFG